MADLSKVSQTLVKDAFEPLHVYDEAIAAKPELIVPMAVVHLIPIALVISGGIAIIRGAQKIRLEKEKTRQIRLNAELGRKHRGRR